MGYLARTVSLINEAATSDSQKVFAKMSSSERIVEAVAHSTGMSIVANLEITLLQFTGVNLLQRSPSR